MKMVSTLMITGGAAILLMVSSKILAFIPFNINANEFVNQLAKYQLFALLIAGIVTFATVRLNQESRQLFRMGDLSNTAHTEKWLGINGKTSWRKNGIQLLLFISIATGIFMFLAVSYTDSLSNFQVHYVPLILLFSLTNSLAEELIFRFGIAGGLMQSFPKLVVLLVSAVLFGMPHYFGNPSGMIGVLMSGVLGYILCKASLETKGLGIAWSIHFVQDIIIFTALFMIMVE